ncbi:hypothetical protein AVEN_102075-1 [Araneus ventricosus]|uniref:Uncharacterized protein n=1 Tax=Araneus ventricosus TaxID=182803 RepID=A0A4Y2RVH8_ARAVE|nr:hypothetical protein AVEN_102075-1 [Araneus ventricosus]
MNVLTRGRRDLMVSSQLRGWRGRGRILYSTQDALYVSLVHAKYELWYNYRPTALVQNFEELVLVQASASSSERCSALQGKYSGIQSRELLHLYLNIRGVDIESVQS